jgi:integrase
VKLGKGSDENGFWGSVEIRRGLKRKERRRDLPITEDMAAVHSALRGDSECRKVFTSLRDRTQPLSVNTLADQHRAIMETCTFHPDEGLHALRQTFLTEAGQYTQNVRALQKLAVAGHCRIQTTMRYVHPDRSDVLEIAGAVQRSRQSAVTTVFTTPDQQQPQGARKM